MIRPLGDYLVLLPFGKKPGMVGLIHLPDTGTLSTATSCRCGVIAAGPKADEVKEGDVVEVKAYGQHPAGVEVRHEGKNLVMIRQRDIIGVVRGLSFKKGDKGWGDKANWGLETPDTDDDEAGE